MRSQCYEQRKFPIVQLNLRPVRRIELYLKVCTEAKYFVEKISLSVEEGVEQSMECRVGLMFPKVLK